MHQMTEKMIQSLHMISPTDEAQTQDKKSMTIVPNYLQREMQYWRVIFVRR